MSVSPCRAASVLAALASLVLAVPCSAEEIHIFPGDSFETAAESLEPGDTLIVHAGTYSHANALFITVQGTPQAPVVIQGADGEAAPLIVLTASGHNVVGIDGATHVTIRGLEITGNGIGGADGVNLRGNPSNITLEDLEIHDVSVGINFRSSMSNIVARRNHIYDTRDTGEGMYLGCHDGSCAVTNSIIENNWIHDTDNSDQGDGIEIKRGSHSNIVRDNVIHDTFYPCITIYGTDGGERNVVERNVVWNCADAAMQIAADSIIRNNILIPGNGIGFASKDHAGVTPDNLEFVHNTILGGSPCLDLRSWSNKSGMVFANNAVYCENGSYTIDGLSGVEVSGNVFKPLPGAVPGAGNSEGRTAAEDFVDHLNSDLYPTSDSALLSAGNAAYAAGDDFNGTPRNGGADAGAYAWTGATNPGWAVTAGFKDAAAPGPTLEFTATPSDVEYQGASVLAWQAGNATGCTASGAWSGAKATSGSENTGALLSDATFRLDCEGEGGSISRSATVTVQADTSGAGGSGGGGTGGGDTGGGESGGNDGGSGGGATFWLLLGLLGAAALRPAPA